MNDSGYREQIKSAAVVGAGQMGHGIALVFARAGIEVRLIDVSEDVLDRATRLIEASLGVMSACGKLGQDETSAIIARIGTTTDLEDGARGVDFVVEAVPEVPEVKKELFSRLDALCPEDVIIASNTSGLDIFEFAEVERPQRLLIAHWFLPPHIIPLVEVVPGAETSPEAVSATVALLERLGKAPVAMKGFTRAFIVNKIQNMISLAVFELLGSGLVTPEDIDRAVKSSLGIRLPVVGVVQSLDFTGLDLVLDLMKSYGLTNRFIADKVEAGHLGAKTARGIYDYGERSEAEILAERDRRYLQMLDRLEEIGAFEPV
ncbi:MAG: 3-hydroxyacyl-CoA dehydrogenase family protein [Actinobacteria bacterium]|nr:3-hydroxyacyl-CoA dehydrogenase family protein [Actinomycetota bacterium]